MTTSNQVVAVLNFLTSKVLDYCPDNCDSRVIEALISNYFDSDLSDGSDGSDDESSDERDCKNEGANTQIQYVLNQITLL